ncbi:putative protein tyrosine phosphatase [Trypanosoma conorhini]|uniref:Uncharacterized protein n=1 Tax=Trypanosoma conorhini TaxID=83891 RepID=A0A3R7L2K2_9TRYP|nr:putative protein tyrosine phosphatase [Trypanosoma conorhini]RNF06312.1 putative protein tyrosine phosphatase [Trypanosoma conorhini]
MPQPLQELLETRQALEVIPGVLYFASVGEKLRSMGEQVGSAASSRSGSLRPGEFPREDAIEASAACAVLAASAAESLDGDGRRPDPPHARPRTPPINIQRVRSDVAHSVVLRHALLLDNGGAGGFGGEYAHRAFYFSVNESPSFQYCPYFADFGPLGLDAVTRFSRSLAALLERCVAYGWRTDAGGGRGAVFGPREFLSGRDLRHRGEAAAPPNLPIVFCSGLGNHERANAACLLACFCVAALRWSAEATWRVFQACYPPIIPFRDASCGASTFPLLIPDVIAGLEKAIALGWYDVRDFDLAEYARLRRYDCNWVVPHVFLALSSPDSHVPGRGAEVYARLFQQLRVTHLVRLNESLYRRETFLAGGVQHFDLQFADGSAPTDDIINRFLKLVEPVLLPSQRQRKRHKQKGTVSSRQVAAGAQGGGGAVALHCRAGLGRTGTLICVYMMRHFGLTARESIGWIRLCRPGCVMGVQQGFLERLERRLSRPARDAEVLRAEQSTRGSGSRYTDAGGNCTCRIHGPRQVSSAPASRGCRTADAAESRGAEPRRFLAVHDAAALPRRSLMRSFKHPASYFLALEQKEKSRRTPASAPPGPARIYAEERTSPVGDECSAPLVPPRPLPSSSLVSLLAPPSRAHGGQKSSGADAESEGTAHGCPNGSAGGTPSPRPPPSSLPPNLFTPRSLPSTWGVCAAKSDPHAGARPPRLLQGRHGHLSDGAASVSGNHDASDMDEGSASHWSTGPRNSLRTGSNFRAASANGATTRGPCFSTTSEPSVGGTAPPSVPPHPPTKRLLLLARKAAAAAAADAALTDPGWGAVAVRLEP